jgi:hypothetical protein
MAVVVLDVGVQDANKLAPPSDQEMVQVLLACRHHEPDIPTLTGALGRLNSGWADRPVGWWSPGSTAAGTVAWSKA